MTCWLSIWLPGYAHAKNGTCVEFCVHTISAITCQGEEVENYIFEHYHIAKHIKAYEPIVNPISGPNLWPKTGKEPSLLPKKLKFLGRPKQDRKN